MTCRELLHIIETIFSKNIHENQFRKRRCLTYENDISAEEEIQIQGARIPVQNEHSRRKKSFSRQKGKRKKSIVRVKIVVKNLVRCLFGLQRGLFCDSLFFLS